MRVIVGSTDCPLSTELISTVAGVFSAAAPDEAFGVRVPTDAEGPSTPVERLVESVAKRLGRRVIRFSPGPGGRAAIFRRDYDLVEGAEAVVAFFSPEREMEGGTGHVVKAALDRGVRVEAYSVRPDGTLVYLGSDEDPVQGGDNPVLQSMWKAREE